MKSAPFGLRGWGWPFTNLPYSTMGYHAKLVVLN